MPISGMTDRGLAFPEIGQIRKGAKKTENRPGADLTYFRVEFDEREQKAAEAFNEVYKDYKGQPTAIRIVLPFNEIERMWDAWLEAYTAGRMVARSDGEKFVYLIDCNTGEMLVKNGIDIATGQPRPYVEGKPVGYYKKQSGGQEPVFCKPSGRLKVILPELARAAYVTVLTTSKHDIINISDQLRAFQTLNAGRIAGIPLILRRRPKKISTPNADGTRARRVKWLLSIEADPEWVRAAFQHTARLALPGGGMETPSPLLPPGYEPADETDQQAGYEPDEDEREDVAEGEYTEHETPGNFVMKITPEFVDRVMETVTPETREKDKEYKPDEEHQTKLDAARNMRTPHGKQFGELTDDQLRTILNHPQATQAEKDAAAYILE